MDTAELGAILATAVVNMLGALLVHNARLLTLAARLRVGSLSLGLFLNLAADGSLTDTHEELIHGRVRGQREYIEALHPIAAGVGEFLGDVDSRDIARDLCPHGRRHAQRLVGVSVRRCF